MKICSKCVTPETAESLIFDENNTCSACKQISFKNEKVGFAVIYNSNQCVKSKSNQLGATTKETTDTSTTPTAGLVLTTQTEPRAKLTTTGLPDITGLEKTQKHTRKCAQTRSTQSFCVS